MDQAEKGNHEAIREVAKLAASHIKDLSIRGMNGNDELTDFIVKALDKIAENSTPNDAFSWSRRGAQPQNRTLLEWHLAQYVKDAISIVGGTAKAIEIIAEAANMDGSKSGKVEKAYHRWKDISMPQDIFPICPTTDKQIKLIENKLDEILKKYRQK
ncbi:MAG: hypothetical protein ACXW00_02040 [Methylobacter sp.]